MSYTWLVLTLCNEVLAAIFPGVSTRQDLRAFHSSEIPIVFGTYNLTSPTESPSTTEITLSRYMQRAWVAFARNPIHGLIDFGWPLYNPNTTTLAQLGGITNQTGVAFTRGNLTDSPCADQNFLIQIQNQLSGLLGAWKTLNFGRVCSHFINCCIVLNSSLSIVSPLFQKET